MKNDEVRAYGEILTETAKSHYNNFVSLLSIVMLLKSQDKTIEEIVAYIHEIGDIWTLSFNDYMDDMSLIISKIDPDFDKEDFQHIFKQMIDKSITVTKAESFSLLSNMLDKINNV